MKKLFLSLLLIWPAVMFGQQIVTLDGSVSNDPDGTISSYRWRQVSGPATAIIADSTAKKTTVSIPYIAGDYKFQLIVTDNLGLASLPLPASFTTVHVLPNPDHAPVITPAPDQLITLPKDSVILKCIATDQDHDKLGYLWKWISGPNTPVILKPADSITTVKGLIQGLYKFEVTVTDAPGAFRKDTIQVAVNAANVPPAANAGPDQTINLPASTVFIGIQDPPGIRIKWQQTAGPSGPVIVSPDSSISEIRNLVQGDFDFKKTSTTDSGQWIDFVHVKVYPKCNIFDKLFHRHGCSLN